MQPGPAISLCMIVKNEEKHLRDCLESIRELVHQIVIVDTGSTDSTVEIARSLGAEVFFFPWIDDFAAARNESLRHATGEWVIWLDADERLNCLDNPNCLAESVSIPGIDAFVVPIRSYRKENGFDFHYAVRLFRRFPGISFEGKVHEFVDPFLLRMDAKISPASFLIEHLGYCIDKAQMNGKLRRNLELLRKSVEQNPDDAYTQYYLGLTLIGFDRAEESFDALQRALEGRGLTPNLRALVLNLIAFHHLSRGKNTLAMDAAMESLNAVPRQNTARLFAGITHYNRKQHDLALPYLMMAYQFLRLPPERRRTDISQEHSYFENDLLRAIGICHAEKKEYAQAVMFFHRFLESGTADPEVFRLMGICYINCQDFASGLRYLEEAKSNGAASAQISIPMAYAHFRIGEIEQAMDCLLEAGEEALAGQEAHRLIETLVTACFDADRADRACDFLDRLTRKYPAQTELIEMYGTACIRSGDFRRAIEAHKRLLALHPHDEEVLRRIAGLFVKTGDLDGARRVLDSMNCEGSAQ